MRTFAYFETAVITKGTARSTKAGATGGLEDAAHQAAVALHVLNTILKNIYKNDPANSPNGRRQAEA